MNSDKPDAGLQSLDHYKVRLPKWRYGLRQKLIPLVRMETPYLAWVQERVRSPALDSYFAVTANLGTHTFFMVMLPVLFWCGLPDLGRTLVRLLASGVFFSGFLKDMFCLPRPLSPPLQRITMSGSTALEYGFPSTHSTNAVSVAVYTLYRLRSSDSTVDSSTQLILEIISYGYAASIVFGRLYCGMHGFFDVIIGSLIGVLIAIVECVYGLFLNEVIDNSSYRGILLIAVTVLILVRIHPEPADDCPCFDDSVAFAGVFIGCELASWHYSGYLTSPGKVDTAIPFSVETLGWPTVVARIIFGVATIFAWRGIMKPTLLRTLPPLYRFIEKHGMNLPRKYFMQASEYKRVPSNVQVDSILPNVSDIPKFINSVRTGRGRAVSIGPQSAADAYETLAYREKRRRESITSAPLSPKANGEIQGTRGDGYFSMPASNKVETEALEDSSVPAASIRSSGRKKSNSLSQYEQMMGSGTVLFSPDAVGAKPVYRKYENRREEEKEDLEMFSNVQKPRVRYDVEVVTKLVVYAGIAILAVEGNPLLFDAIGLGMSKRAS